MSEYFDAVSNRVSNGVTARASDVNSLRDEVGVGFDKLVSEDDAKKGTINYATVGGTVDALTLTLPYAPAAYTDGMEVVFKSAGDNTGAVTVNVNSLGVKSLVSQTGTALIAADLSSGDIFRARYNSTSGKFQLEQSTPQYLSNLVTAAELAETNAAASEAAAGVSETNAAASAASAAADLLLTNADVVSTNADVVSTNADAVATAADLVQTNLDQISCAANAALTAADVVSTNADVVSTNADAASTAADVLLTAADAASTAADVLLTAADVVSCDADATAAAASAVAAAASAASADAGLSLVERQTLLVDTANVSFTGLDILTDNAYVLVINGGTTGTNYSYIAFNGQNPITNQSAHTCQQHYTSSTTHSVAKLSEGKIGRTGALGQCCRVDIFLGKYDATGALYAMYVSQDVSCSSAGSVANMVISGMKDLAVTNITEIQVEGGNDWCAGTVFALYKRN